MAQVTFPIRTLAELGIRNLLLTNAAGGINKKFRPGDFMVLTDHINLMGANPLRGNATPGGPGFVDMTRVYDSNLNALLFQAGQRSHLQLRRGVYLAVSGPSYETPAEIRAFARLGADAVGMSTVPEAHGGAAMRIECGGSFRHHQPGGGPGAGTIVARGGAENRGTGEGFGSGIAEKLHETLW